MVVVWLVLLSILAVVIIGQGCHPECSYQCSDPVCPAKCTAVAATPTCAPFCNGNYTPIANQCLFYCITQIENIEDICESDSCPFGETLCTELYCSGLPVGVECEIQCEAPQLGWQCVKPTKEECPEPECELMCEAPACEATFEVPSKSNTLTIPYITWIILLCYLGGIIK